MWLFMLKKEKQFSSYHFHNVYTHFSWFDVTQSYEHSAYIHIYGWSWPKAINATDLDLSKQQVLIFWLWVCIYNIFLILIVTTVYWMVFWVHSYKLMCSIPVIMILFVFSLSWKKYKIHMKFSKEFSLGTHANFWGLCLCSVANEDER